MTAENQIPSYILSSLTRRTGAFLIDCLIMGALGAVAGSILPVLGGLAAWFFYGPVLESSELRATIGKNLLGIQVVDLAGQRITLRAAFIRNLMKIISAMILLIGFFVALFTSKKQTLHDLLAETIVIYHRSDVPVVDAWIESSKEVFRIGKRTFDASPLAASKESESMITQLERLKELHRQGALSDEQYELAKIKILKP